MTKSKDKIQTLPSENSALIPYINIKGAADAIKFYKKVFNAKEIGRIHMPDGNVAHAELQIEGSKIMVSEENEQWGNKTPQTLGGTPVYICLYVSNVDATFEQALQEGAKKSGKMGVQDQFYGNRAGTLTDPFGHQWTIMTHIEDVSYEEMQRRSDSMHAQQKNGT